MFKAKIRKVGTSFGILLPKEIVKEQKLREGQNVNVSVLKEKKNRRTIRDVWSGTWCKTVQTK